MEYYNINVNIGMVGQKVTTRTKTFNLAFGVKLPNNGLTIIKCVRTYVITQRKR